jgi:serine/threonine protein kinase/CRP-like cAMP-binding protein
MRQFSRFWSVPEPTKSAAPSPSPRLAEKQTPRSVRTFDQDARARRELDPCARSVAALEAETGGGTLLLVHTAFEARYSDEASLIARDVVVGYKLLADWWLGSSRSRVGIFPATHVTAWRPAAPAEGMSASAKALWRDDPLRPALVPNEAQLPDSPRVSSQSSARRAAGPQPLQVLRDVAGWVDATMTAPAAAVEAGDAAAEAAAPSNEWMNSTAEALDDMGEWIATWSGRYGVAQKRTAAKQVEQQQKMRVSGGGDGAAAAKLPSAPGGGLMIITDVSPVGSEGAAHVVPESLVPLTAEELLLTTIRTKSSQDEEEIMTALKSHWMFSKLSELVLIDIVTSAKQLVVQEGTAIIRQGSSDSRLFYIIARGMVDVLVQAKDSDECNVVAQLGPGRTFGEAALLLAGTKRNATILATGPVRMWTIDRITFKRLLGGHATQSLDATKDVLRQSRTLADLDEAQLSKLAAVVEPQTFEAGGLIVKKGELGDSCYILREGNVVVSEIDGAADITLTEGACFGEVALMSNAPRSATVSAGAEGCTVLTLVRGTVEEVLGPLRPLLEKNLGHLVIGSILNTETHVKHVRELSMNWLEREDFVAGALIQTLGEPCASLSVVVSGSAELGTEGGRGITVGGFFGAEALDEGEFGTASVGAVPVYTDTARAGADGASCMRLSRRAFGIVVYGHRDVEPTETAAAPATKEQRTRRRRRASMKMEKPTALTTAMIYASIKSIEELKVVRTLGCGSFGRVYLVEHEATHKQFALKSLQKGFIMEMRQADQIKTEREVMASIESPFVIKLITSFQDAEHIYMGMELSSGGELQMQLDQHDSIFTAYATAFYGVGIAAGVSHLHAANIAYRDLKPSNVMLDERGFPKLIDFGLAKKMKPGKLTFTLCGTPEYIAPEIASLTGHNHVVDWWAFGVMLYECLLGAPPFVRSEFDEYGLQLYRTLQTADVEVPLDAGPTKELLSGLLEKDYVRRLGNLGGGVDDILGHDFFTSRASVVLPCPGTRRPPRRARVSFSAPAHRLLPPPPRPPYPHTHRARRGKGACPELRRQCSVRARSGRVW